MLDALRTSLHRALVTRQGDGVTPLRVAKDLARRLNVTLGEPLCSEEDLRTRRAAEEKLQVLAKTRAEGGAPREKIALPAAPVKVYAEKDRNQRELTRIRELLDAKGIVYEVLDVTGDEATIEFVTRTARCEQDELPVVFLGAMVLGGYEGLANADLSRALKRDA
jgi:glutaredoxin